MSDSVSEISEGCLARAGLSLVKVYTVWLLIDHRVKGLNSPKVQIDSDQKPGGQNARSP